LFPALVLSIRLRLYGYIGVTYVIYAEVGRRT